MIELQEPLEPKITLDPQPEVNRVEMPIALNRANKYDFGLGDNSPGRDQLAASVLNGTESHEREQAVIRKSVEDQRTRMGLIQEITSKGAAITPEDYDNIMALSSDEATKFRDNPSTFFEKATAKRLTNDSHGDNLRNALDEAPGVAHAILDAQEKIHGQKETIQKIVEDGEARFGRESIGSKALAYAETFVPGWTWSSVASIVPDAPRSGILPGTIVEDQYTYLLGLPSLEDFQSQAKAAFEDLYSQSPTDAIVWARGLAGFSTSDKYLFNTIGITDIATVIPVGKIAGMAARGSGMATATTAKTAVDALKASGTRTFRPEAMKIVSGDAEGAAIDIAAKKIKEKASGVSSPSKNPLEDLMGETDTMFNPAAALGQDFTTSTHEQVQRLVTQMSTRAAGLLNSIADPLMTGRIQGESLKTALEEAKRTWNSQYKVADDAILNRQHVQVNGMDHLEVQVGTKDGSYFKSMLQAHNMAKRWYGFKDNYAVKQYGDGQFYISSTKPLDETSPAVRDVLIETHNQTPKTITNMLLGYIRSADYLISRQLSGDYKTAAYGASAFMKQVQEAAKPISLLRNSQKKELSSFLQKQRVYIDPTTGQGPGKYSKTQGEFEKEWLDHTGRSPSLEESDAYWTNRQLNDFNYIVENYGLMRDKLRQGIENFSFGFSGKPSRAAGEPITAKHLLESPQMTPQIEGKYIPGGFDSIPWANKEDTSIMIIDARTGKPTSVRKKFTNAQKLKEDHGNGYELFQLSPEGKRVLKDHPDFKDYFDKSDHSFILVNKFETSPLNYKQIPYKPGGRIEYTDGWYVRQPSVKATEGGSHYYQGDMNLYHFQTETQAREAAAAAEKARQLLKANQMEALDMHIQQNLPHKTDDWVKLFKDGSLDIDTPIYASPQNRSIREFYKLEDKYPNMVDGRESAYNLYNGVNLKYAMERDQPLYTFSKNGDPDQPIFNLEYAKMIDPLATLNRSTAALMKGRFLEDLKFKVSENFLAEFSGVLDVPISEMRLNPMKHLIDPKWRKGADPIHVAAAKNYRRVAVNFLGLKNDFQKNTRWLKQKLADSIFKVSGEKGFNIVEPYLLHRTKDPITFFRSVAFHTYLGFFNPVQLFLQAQTVAHVAAIEGPVRGFQGLTGALTMRAAMMSDDPKIWRSAAQKAAKMGYGSEEEFLESFHGMKRSGFDNVGGEYAARDDMLDPNVVVSAGRQIADKGTVFFREGERLSRMTAWNAAYKRWRGGNASKPFDDAAIKEVLQRADLLNVNMSRASLAAWNTGFASVPTQFLSYQARLSEQFLGKALTPVEKARGLLTYSALYGVPIGAGLGTFGLNPFSGNPMYSDVRGWLMDKGIEYDDNLVTKTMVDGIGSMMTEMVLGQKYNVGGRYGPSGPTLIQDILSGDKTVIETVLGASGTSLGAAYASASPFLYSMVQTLSSDDNWLPVAEGDLKDFVSNISSVNNMVKLHAALTVGEYITKNGTKVPLGGKDGWVGALFGLKPQSVEDMFNMMNMNKIAAEGQKEARKQYNKYMQRGWQSMKTGDDEEAKSYFTAAKLWAQMFREDQRAGLLQGAMKSKDLYTSVGESWSKGNPVRMQTWLNMLQKKQEVLDGNR